MAAVPELKVVTPDNTAGEPTKVKRSDSCHVDVENFHKSAQERKKEEGEWLQKLKVSPVFNTILREILEQRPAQPVDSFWRSLTRTEKLEEAAAHGDTTDPRDVLKSVSDKSALHYLHDSKLNAVFDELVTTMLNDRPKEPLAYSLTWLRFNAKHLIDAETEIEHCAEQQAEH
ncbi:hypothetical protein DIPPA_70019 [Diplonema papillatum]|nr:hypothetical protein DIPPA_70019 [Diplonema papillatum]